MTDFGLGTEADLAVGLELAEQLGWGRTHVERGDPFIAREEGEVVGFMRLIDCPPEGVYVADVMVREDLRGKGIGSGMMRAAMTTRPGPFYLVCHPERVPFYERLGYEDVTKGSWPSEIVVCSKAEDDFDSDHDHLHYFMRRA